MDCDYEMYEQKQTNENGHRPSVDEAGTAVESDAEVNTQTLQMSLGDIEASMKQMIDEVNNKRENDLAILEEVKKEIMAQAKRSCMILEQHMANMHAAKGKEIDEKWDALVKVLNGIKESEEEIEKTKTSLSFLCKDVSEAEA